jgi:hypothetical protein
MNSSENEIEEAISQVMNMEYMFGKFMEKEMFKENLTIIYRKRIETLRNFGKIEEIAYEPKEFLK